MNNLNVVYFFFEDDFTKWAHRDLLTSWVNTAEDMRLIGIHFPFSLGTLLANPFRFFRSVLRREGRVTDKIVTFTPFALLPLSLVNRIPFFIKIHKFIFKIQINNYLKKIGADKNRVTWIYCLDAGPAFWDIIGNSKLLVYDCKDEFILSEDSAVLIKFNMQTEDRLLKDADIVFTTSRALYETKKRKNKNCYLNPNGVDFSFFNRAIAEYTEVNEEMGKMPRPIVGYLGNLRSWLDFELLEFLADNLPESSFVFVGPVEHNVREKVASLKKRTNVYFIGRKDREELPGILKGFDVCLIPFKYNEFNLSTNPLKFWEYLATGKPILSLKILDLEPHSDMVSLYTTRDEALANLLLLLKEERGPLQERRMDLAKKNDLASRSKLYYEILLRHLNECK